MTCSCRADMQRVRIFASLLSFPLPLPLQVRNLAAMMAGASLADADAVAVGSAAAPEVNNYDALKRGGAGQLA